MASAWNKYGRGTSALLGYGLGATFGIGIAISLLSRRENVDIGLFLAALSFFHCWEYMYVSLFHPNELTADCKFISRKGANVDHCSIYVES